MTPYWVSQQQKNLCVRLRDFLWFSKWHCLKCVGSKIRLHFYFKNFWKLETLILSKKYFFFEKVPKSGSCCFSASGFKWILSNKVENVPKPTFFVNILKKTYYKINHRIFFCIFWGFQNFQISRFQKIWKVSENSCFDKLQHIGNFSHSVLVTEFDFSLRIFEFSFSRNFQIPDFLESGIWKFQEYDDSKILSA